MKTLSPLLIRTKTILFSILITIGAFAQSPQTTTDFQEHMLEVNAQWSHMAEAPAEIIEFANENERIATHLKLVIADLLENPRNDEPQKADSRQLLLNSLSDYADRGVFPKNTRHQVRTPYFIDDYGTACAVGHMIIASGHEDLALKISSEHNYDYIKDIDTDGLNDWATEHGFTSAELTWIQPGYPAPSTLTGVGQGVNGNIHCMSADIYESRVYIAGDFDMMDSTTNCSGFGYIESNQYYCMSAAPTGEINKIDDTDQGNLFLTGNLQLDGSTYPLAYLSDGTWTGLAIEERPGATGVEVVTTGTAVSSKIYLALKPVNDPSISEVWYLSDLQNGTWTRIISVDGDIHCAELVGGEFYFGGEFSSCTNHIAADVVTMTNNLVGIYVGWNLSAVYVTPFDSDHIPDQVWAIHTGIGSGNIFYVGGGSDLAEDNLLLCRFQNGVFQPLFIAYGPGTVKDIQSMTEQNLLLSGEFYMAQDFIGYYGLNLGTYNLLTGHTNPLAVLNQAVNGSARADGLWYFGGDFTDDQGYPVNHIARSSSASGLSELSSIGISVYPNPTTDELRIDAPSDLQNYRLMDVQGKLVGQGVVTKNSIDMRPFGEGTYVLEMSDGDRRYTTSVVKN